MGPHNAENHRQLAAQPHQPSVQEVVAGKRLYCSEAEEWSANSWIKMSEIFSRISKRPRMTAKSTGPHRKINVSLNEMSEPGADCFRSCHWNLSWSKAFSKRKFYDWSWRLSFMTARLVCHGRICRISTGHGIRSNDGGTLSDSRAEFIQPEAWPFQ